MVCYFLFIIILKFISFDWFLVQIFAHNLNQNLPSSNNSIIQREKCQSNVCFNGGICFIKLNSEGLKEFECDCEYVY